MKLLVSLAPQALWQAKQSQFALSSLSYAALNAPGNADTAPEPAPEQALLISDSLNLTQLAALLKQYPDSEFVLAYAAPEQQLGLQLAQGDTPEQAATSWCRQIKALLQLQQQQRRRLKLFTLNFNAKQGAALPAWLQYQADAHQPCPPDSLYTVLGAQLLRQHDNCAALLVRLDASSLPLSTDVYQFDITALQQQAGDTSALDSANEQLKASNAERDLLLQKLLHVQETLEQAVLAKQTLEQQYSAQEQALREQVTTLNARLQQDEQKLEQSLAQLQQMQHELAGVNEVQSQSQLQVQQLTAQQQQLQQQLQSANSQLAASNDERDLLLQQLLHVQEELEQLFQKKQTVKQQYSQLEQDYRSEVASLSAKLQHGEQTVEKTASQLHGLQDELKRITAAHNQSQQQIKQLGAQQQQLQQQLQSANSQLAASNDERDLLLQQLLHVQEELEQLFHKEQAAKQQLSLLQQEYRKEISSLNTKLTQMEQKYRKETSSLNTKLAQATTQIADISKARDIRSAQLQQVQQELEQYYLKWQQAELKATHANTARDKQQQRELSKLESQLRKSKARAAGAEHKLELLQQEFSAVKNSTLWKTGAPVRALTRLVKKTDPAKQKLQQEAALIITSEYFDIDWYLQRYPDVAEAKINPAEHYLRFGASEGRMPGPLFDGDWYLQRYPDVAQSGINPLLHFIKFGQLEGRSASPKLLADNSTREE